MTAKIIIATHKKYRMPSDAVYLPVQVGADGKADLGYQKDNEGENISGKNKNYCELTGLYWAWKNLDVDIVGLAHYRRHFALKSSKGDKWDRILTAEQLEAALDGVDAILPNPRNYFIESNYSQYVHAHHAEDLDKTREIIAEKYPDYIPAYDAYMKRSIGHRFNMFIMRRPQFDAYCQWMFDILFELEKRLDISGYNANDSRVFGFVSERLIDIWLETNSIKYKELPCMFMEKQNWIVKGFNFLKRKFMKIRK